MPLEASKRTGRQCVEVSLDELLGLSKVARQFSLTPTRAKSLFTGQQHSRFFGRGMEFAESRRYEFGDDVRNIDWRVTARTGKPHTKLFHQEKERQVLFCIDCRSSMFFATKGIFKSAQATLIGGFLSWNASQKGNRVGGVFFDNSSVYESRPRLGKKGLFPFLDALATNTAFEKRDQTLPLKGDSFSMDLAFESLKKVASSGSLIFIVSDFRSFSDKAYGELVDLSKHHDICLCMIYDPLEMNLPANGSYKITNGREAISFSGAKKNESYEALFLERKKRLLSLVGKNHFHLLECSTEKESLDFLNTYFR